MIIVHDIFICKPGQASKMAKMFKEMMKDWGTQSYVMTDVVGQFNKVIVATPYESLTAYEQSMEKWMKPPTTAKEKAAAKKSAAGMKNYHDMFLTGSREIYRVA